MRIGLIASPFISVPPARYGGTELFVAQLAEGLKNSGFDVVVYANGESQLSAEIRWLYKKSQWPIDGELYATLKDMNHSAWAIRDAWDEVDVIHVNNVTGLPYSRFDGPRFVYTIHHAYNEHLSEFYKYYPQVNYVTISNFQQAREQMPRMRMIHHGVDMNRYPLQASKRKYLAFLGRIAPMKGTHTAIEIAKKSGVPLKIAGEIQPIYREYFETQVKPHIDGKLIEYIGEADLENKNELLGGALAMLFPIHWNEPFGLVMIEAMAKGTPVLAFPGGAVEEVIAEGVSGHICRSVDEMVDSVRELEGRFDPENVRAYAAENFSVERMVKEYASLYRELMSNSREGVGDVGSRPARFAPARSDQDLRATLDEEIAALTDDPEEPRAVA